MKCSILIKAYRFVQDNKLDDAAVESIGDSLGSVILRPGHESLTTLTSRVPMYFGRDLIKHYDTFFNEATLKSHAESEKRRQARPLRAESNLADATRQPQQRRSLMSFMRSNNEEKWNMIFQRNAAGTTSAASSSAASVASSERVSSSSFTRPTPMTSGTATMQDSPPLSPVKAPAPPPPSEEASNSAPEKQSVEKKKEEVEGEVNDKNEPNHGGKVKQDDKNKEDDKPEQAPAKDTVVFDVVQESRKDNDEALDPFFDDED